ncbi:MAG TPA: DUF3800 domain-containing protein [Candidatus Pacearchaeota archaeon]|jgi:hypothetical protein|nr:DUF3800 domain-containing protein [Candidatus Pacearchaeota archaeon]
MENNKYLIFSDESGCWSDRKCDFYIRSWIKIAEERYLYLKGLWETRKLPNPTKKSLLKKNGGISKILNGEKFDVIFTITKLNEFYLRKWGVRDSVSLALSQLENSLLKTYEKKIPPKLEVALNQILFLNVYERFHIENAVDYLEAKNGSDYEFLINKPQFSENDYLEIFNDIKNKKELSAKISFIKNSESELGVCFADAICSIFSNALVGNEVDIAYLKNNILSKGVSSGIGIKGINKIFYPVNKSYGSDKLQGEEINFIDKLRSIFN